MSMKADYRDKPIDALSWRIAIRQADMLIRRASENAQLNHVGPSGRRRPGRSLLAAEFEKLADEVWHELSMPPKSVRQAYKFDERVEATRPARSTRP